MSAAHSSFLIPRYETEDALIIPYEAAVFDMDGVLADSEPVYFAAIQAVLGPLGHEVTEKHQREIMGHSIQDTWAYLRDTFKLEGPVDDLVKAYDEDLVQRLRLVREPLPGCASSWVS